MRISDNFLIGLTIFLAAVLGSLILVKEIKINNANGQNLFGLVSQIIKKDPILKNNLPVTNISALSYLSVYVNKNNEFSASTEGQSSRGEAHSLEAALRQGSLRLPFASTGGM